MTFECIREATDACVVRNEKMIILIHIIMYNNILTLMSNIFTSRYIDASLTYDYFKTE